MKLLYALGGGLGHITRGSALIASLNLSYEDFVIITNSPYTRQIFQKSIIELISEDYYNNPEGLRKRIESIISRYQIDEIYIDAFPAGIIGELNELQTGKCKIYYVARILNWEVYHKLFGKFKLRFEKTFLVEEVQDKQLIFIKSCSDDLTILGLQYPEAQATDFLKSVISSFKRPFWLIVHSGPFDELELIYFHALEISEAMKVLPQFLILSKVEKKVNSDHVMQIDYYPASDFFPFAEKIFTSCGFNVMYQAKEFSEKHIFIPFPRRFDDQFLRAKRRKDLILKSV